MLRNFEGSSYRLCDNWFKYVKVDNYKNQPIKYLEIGTFYGANFFSVGNTYGSHSESKLFCIDPWDLGDDSYSGKETYDTFLKNVENSGFKDKITIHKGFSNEEILKFDDDYFDIIYIDGNHEPEYALEDAVLSFRKLKKGGVMIFDDYGWGGPDMTKRGIDGFLNGYHKRIKKLGEQCTQVFLEKIN